MSVKKPSQDYKDHDGFYKDRNSKNGDCYSNKKLPGNSVEKEGYDSSLTVPPGKAVFESFGDHQPINVKKK
ncbi:hypothetical protein [Atlantibacter hermannii]|uniref:hypothetical protein n=1 Tax=Atlantibacter hermannii TaxID=565 RepID=UPI0013EEF57F|nr:hypothetical protein [Atlantibacter hermannii]